MEMFRPMGNYPTQCPECFEPKGLELIPSKSSFILKGTGWYETDYASKK
jgi:predicted nucleic acid-binding Zn ribbon protein